MRQAAENSSLTSSEKENNQKAFFKACAEGQIETVEALLKDPNVDVNQPNAHGDSPLWIACCVGHTEIVQLLLNSSGVDVNEPSSYRSPLGIACVKGHTEVIRLLLNKSGIDVNQPDKHGNSPLWTACRYGHAEVVRLLLDGDADVNKPNNDGDSPLWTACGYGYAEIVQLLLNQPNINVNQPNNGKTVLSLACHVVHTEIVRYLLNAGADLTQSDANKLLDIRENIIRDDMLNVSYSTRKERAATLLELNKIAYLLCTLPKDNPISRNWDMNNETLAEMVHAGRLYYEEQEQVQNIQTIYSELPAVTKRPLRNFLEVSDAQEAAEATQTSTVAHETHAQTGAQVTTVAALLANSTVVTTTATATPTARDATAEEEMAAADTATAGSSSL